MLDFPSGGAGDEPAPADLLRLIEAVAREADRAAFAALFHHYAPKLKSFLLRGGIAEGAAEEIVQEVMLTVWQQAASFDPARASPSTWIFTIARNRRIDLLRREVRPAPETAPGPWREEETAPAADGLVERIERTTSLISALDALPSDQADVLRMAYFEEKSHVAIARESRLPLGTVKSRVRAALRRLRRSLETQT